MNRVVLSSELIYAAALRLVDDEGLDALTMRRLAEKIGVATKDDLLLGVVNLATSEMGQPPPDTPPWEALRGITREFRQVSLRHPNLVPLIMRRPPTGSAGLRTLEVALDALRRAGIAPERAAPAYRLMSSFAIGFVSLECGGFFRPVDITAGDQVAPIEWSALPRIAEMAPHLAVWDAGAEFERGMDALIGILQTWVASPEVAQVMESHGGGGGDVEGIDAGGHGDTDPEVGGGQGPLRQPGALGAYQ